MEIKVSMKPSDHWMVKLAEQFGAKSQSPTEFYHTEGESFFRLHATFIEKTVAIFLGDINWSKPLNTLNTALDTNNYWTLVFISSEEMHTHDLQDEKDKYQIQTHKSVLLFSSKMNVNTHWPIGKRSKFVSVSFHRDWLYEQLGVKAANFVNNSSLFKLLSSESGMYIQGVSLFEHNISMDKLFEDTNAFTWRLSAQTQCYQFIADFISQIGKKESLKDTNKINLQDLKQVMGIESRYFVITQPLPNVEFLAQEARVSLSEFKKYFKEIYGLPSYEYHLNQKLEIAKTQLLQNKWSVSEISSQLGYTSSANFDKAFRKRFMMSPTAMLKLV
jgi:AraC-like DNA-binding protein